MENINNIQALINEKADAKLKAAIKTLHNVLSNGESYQLLNKINVKHNFTKHDGTTEQKETSLSYIFSESGVYNDIINNNIERYRRAESQAFLDKVNSLRDDVDNLLSNHE